MEAYLKGMSSVMALPSSRVWKYPARPRKSPKNILFQNPEYFSIITRANTIVNKPKEIIEQPIFVCDFSGLLSYCWREV